MGADLAEALVGGDAVALRAVAKAEAALRAALEPGEAVHALAVDHGPRRNGVVAVASGRLVLVRGGRAEVVAAESVGAVRVADAPDGASVVTLTGLGTAYALPANSHAVRLAAAVATHVTGPTPVRDIPPLHPDACLEVLGAHRIPPTGPNMERLVRHMALALTLGPAADRLEESGDARARDAYLRRFDGGGPPDRALELADDIVDWLWDHHPAARGRLSEAVARMREALASPDGFLAGVGDEVPEPETRRRRRRGTRST